jgi:hypothetical protein
MSNKSSKGGNSRKHGRAGRKPSHNRYNVDRRWEINKARKAAKIKKQLEKKATRKTRKEKGNY